MPDAGSPMDASADNDAGTPPLQDAGPPASDAGLSLDAASPTPDAGSPPDAGMGSVSDGGLDAGSDLDGGELACGTVQAYGDDFESGTLSPRWEIWGGFSTDVVPGGGTLLFDIPGGATDTWQGIASDSPLFLVGGVAEVDWSQVLSQPGAETFVLFWEDTDNFIEMVLDDQGTLSATVMNAGSSTVDTVAYPVGEWMRWRMRDDSTGNVVLEIENAVGVVTPVFTESLPTFVYRGGVLVAGVYASTEPAMAEMAIVDGINVDLPRAEFCPPNIFQDDFGGTSLSHWWWPVGNNHPSCSATIESGELVVRASSNEPFFCRYALNRIQTLSSGSLSVEVVSFSHANQAGTQVGMVLWSPYDLWSDLVLAPVNGNAGVNFFYNDATNMNRQANVERNGIDVIRYRRVNTQTRMQSHTPDGGWDTHLALSNTLVEGFFPYIQLEAKQEFFDAQPVVDGGVSEVDFEARYDNWNLVP
jgi:hypothetical protein